MRLQELEPNAVAVKEGLFCLDAPLLELLQPVLAKGAAFRFKVRGYSMFPFIRDGDIVTVSPLRHFQDIFGQAVAFVHPKSKKIVIHRIIAKSENTYLVKGDTTSAPDAWIRRGDILGLVTKIERNGKKLSWGLGAERFIIAFLSKKLFPLAFRCWKLMPYSLRRITKCLLLL